MFNITHSQEHGTQVTFSHNGKLYTAEDTHPKFEELLAVLHDFSFDKAVELVEFGARAASALTSLSERIKVRGANVYYDNERLYGKMAEDVLTFHNNGWSMAWLLNFVEKLMLNPNPNSREQLYTFIERHNLDILPNGDMLAYKGLREDFGSIHVGDGIVNNVEYTNASLPNTPGAVVELARSRVDADPNSACSTGLHAGTWEYANSFARGKVVLVAINPRDVVSVPSDSDCQKIRCSRYAVMREVEGRVDVQEFYDEEIPEGLTRDEENYVLENILTSFNGYSEKSRLAPSYQALFYGVDWDEDKYMEFAKELDANHTANHVYKYHLRRLLTERGF